jgi:hypothetical protein
MDDYDDSVPNYSGPTSPKRSTWVYVAATLGLLFIGYLIYAWVRSLSGKPLPSVFGGATSTGDQVPVAIDGKERTVINAAAASIGQGGDYGMQFWMYIKDWDYKFGNPKDIVKRVSTSNAAYLNPRVSLNATDNSLDVSIHYYGDSDTATTTTTGASNASGDIFTCTVENVPLQAWFSVSLALFDRNLDIYINGRLVKSCVLPGVPRPATGDIILNDNGGFSGSVCNLRTFSGMLSPSDAQAFFSAGTTCGASSMAQQDDSLFAQIFGYSFRFSILDNKGAEVNQYSF